MAWLKQVSKSFKISVRLLSKRGSCGAAWAKPTPASQINSQLSIEWRSSCLSYKKKSYLVILKIKTNFLTGPNFLLE